MTRLLDAGLRLLALRRLLPAAGRYDLLGLALAAALTVAASAAIILTATGQLDALERVALDARYQLRGARSPRPDVVVAAWDRRQQAATRVRVPLRRDQVKLLHRLSGYGAKAIVWDIDASGLGEDPDADLALGRAFARSRVPIALAVNPDRDAEQQAKVVTLAEERARSNIAGTRTVADTPVLIGNALRLRDRAGTWTTFPDAYADYLPSLAAVGAGLGGSGDDVAVPDGALIDYPGPALTVPRYSISRIIRRTVAPEDLAGKIVVVGYTAPSLGDSHAVPLGARLAGPELQADAIATALDGFPLRRSGPGTDALLAGGLIALVGALSAALIATVGRYVRAPAPDVLARRLIVTAGLTVAAGWTVTNVVLFEGGTVVPYVLGLTAVAFGATASSLTATVRQQAAIRRVLAGDSELLETTTRDGSVTGATAAARLIADDFDVDIGARLGRGGMGQVHVATEVSASRLVALKTIREDLVNRPGYRERFMLEARRAAAVQHPHIITVYRVSPPNAPRLFIAMELIRGENLKERLRREGPMTLEAAAELIHRVATALHAFERGLPNADSAVHCDVKPQNILLGKDPDHPYLTDFGLARAAGGAPGGYTACYAAPELLTGSPVDVRTDVYSLAAVLHECVTGEVPFPPPSDIVELPPSQRRDELVRAHFERANLEQARPRPSDRIAGLAPDVDTLIRSGMSRDPRGRPDRPVLLTAAILDVLDGRPLPDWDCLNVDPDA